jgi:hypothetical protein
MDTEYSINYNSNTIEEAKKYLKYRYKQLLKFGITVKKEIIKKDSVITLYNQENFGSIYILNSYRGKGIFHKRLKEYDIRIITIDECNIENYLVKKNIDHKIYSHSKAYKIIQKYYKDQRTKRSKVPLIYHIDEGGAILEKIGSSNITKDAYYLHPLLQSDEDFNKNKTLDFIGVNYESVILAMEYRRVANSYLSTMDISNFVGFPCEEIKQMLIADKIQNYKDFMKYHYNEHERSKDLYKYFHNWFELLEVDYSHWNSFNFR